MLKASLINYKFINNKDYSITRLNINNIKTLLREFIADKEFRLLCVPYYIFKNNLNIIP